MKEKALDNTEPVTTMYGEQRGRTFESVNLKTFHVLLGGGIVDLLVPTLTVVGLEASQEGDGYNILQITLNPFSQGVKEVGKTSLGDSQTVMMEFRPLFELEWGSCPSLLLSPRILLAPTAKGIYASLLGTLDNGFRLLEGVRQYPLDPFKRVGRERKLNRTGGHQTQDRRLTEGEALELAFQLLRPKAMDMEWKAFILSWAEAIKAEEESPSSRAMMSLKEFRSLFSALEASIRFK